MSVNLGGLYLMVVGMVKKNVTLKHNEIEDTCSIVLAIE